MNIIFRSWMFDFLYVAADQLIEKHNPCKIHKDASGEVHCMHVSPCCSSCKFLGPDGCTTKCLGCKLGLCYVAQNANKKLEEILSKMRTVAYRYRLAGIRTSKEEILDPLRRVYYGKGRPLIPWLSNR